MLKPQRPVHLNLFTIKFPITAIVSILHRLSGCFLFAVIPVFLGLWQLSLKSAIEFEKVKVWLQHPVSQSLRFLVLFALFYHMAAGIRHLIMDTGRGESLWAARLSAYAVLGIALLLTTGVYLCSR